MVVIIKHKFYHLAIIQIMNRKLVLEPCMHAKPSGLLSTVDK